MFLSLLGETLRKLRRYERLLDPMIFKVDTRTGEAHIDVPVLNGYLGIVRKQMELYGKNVRKLNFYNEDSKIDLKDIGGVMRNFKLE